MDDGTQPGEYLETLNSPEAVMQAKMDAANQRAGVGATAPATASAESPYDEELALGQFRRASAPVENRGVLGQNVRMVGNTEKRGRYTGTGWEGGALPDLDEQEQQTFEQARKALGVQALGMRHAAEQQTVEAKAQASAVDALRKEIKDLERRKRGLGREGRKKAPDYVQRITGKDQARYSGFYKAQKSKIEDRIEAIQRELDQGSIQSRSAKAMAGISRREAQDFAGNVENEALRAVLDMRARNQQAAYEQDQQANEMAFEQEKYANDLSLRANQQQFDQGVAQYATARDRRDKRLGDLQANLQMVEEDLADEKQSRTAEAQTTMETRRNALREAIYKLRESEPEGGAQARAESIDPALQQQIDQWVAEGLTLEEIESRLAKAPR